MEKNDGAQTAETYAGHSDRIQNVDDEAKEDEFEQEGMEAVVCAQRAEADALAMIASGQRTLREAREAQARTRLSQGFYKPPRTPNGAPRDRNGPRPQSSGPRHRRGVAHDHAED